MGNTYYEVLKRASSFLEEQGKEGHAILYVFLERKNWTKTDWLIHMKESISKVDERQIKEDLKLLLQDVPPQYLIGHCLFYHQKFFVTKDTLIPRPETEELVDYCLQENKSPNLTVADVGTGTGAIAISVKKANPTWNVLAVDISPKALAVAQKNADNLNTKIQFIHGDGLQPLIQKQQSLDILISNPPYISEKEWELMDESVKKYEPKQALFAENNGLAMYQQLAQEAREILTPDGKIYLEIGFQQAKTVRALMQETFPEKKVEVRKDLFGNDRIIIVR